MGRGKRITIEDSKGILFKSKLDNKINLERELKHENAVSMQHALEKEPPAEILSGNKAWRDSEGRIHRDGDLPAIIYANGRKEWYQKGKLYREGDKPAIIYSNGKKEWFNTKEAHHREGGPAIIYPDGGETWYRHGKLHRDIKDGPAIIRSNGENEYWVKGEKQEIN